jgi:phage-related minor tail protein
MANINEDVSFSIGAKDNTKEGIASAKAGMQGLSDVSASVSDRMTAHWEKFKGAYIAVTAAVASAAATIRKAWDAASKAADYLEQMTMLDALAAKYDTTAQAIVAKVKEMSDGLISSSMAASVSMAALAKGLTPEMVYDLAEASKTLSDVMGVTANEAFKTMAEALEANKTKTLKLAIGIIDLKDKYGEISDTWTEAQKQLAFLNMIKEKAAQITRDLGDAEDSVSDKMERFKNQISAVGREIGMVLIRGVMILLAVFQDLNAQIIYHIALWDQLWGKQDMAAEGFRQSADLAKKAADNFKLALAPEEEWIKAKKRGVAAVKEMTASQGELEKTLKAEEAAMSAMIPAMAKLEEAQLKQANTKYQEVLKAEGATIDSMRDGLNQYLDTINKVYSARIAGEERIAAHIKAAKLNSKESEKADLEALKQEQEMHTKRLEGWRDYYDKLKDMHAKAADAYKAAEAQVQKTRSDIQKEYVDASRIRMSLMEKEAQARGVAATDESIYNMKMADFERRRYEASKLSIDERIEALKVLRSERAAETSEVTRASEVYDQAAGKYVKANVVIQTSLESVRKAQKDVASLTDELSSLQQEKLARDEQAAQKAKQGMESLAGAIKQAKEEMQKADQAASELSRMIGDMQTSVVLNVDSTKLAAAVALARELIALQNQARGNVGGTASSSGGTQNINPWGPGWAGGYTDTGAPIITQGDLPGGVFAMGGVFYGGKVVPFASGGIFNRPTLFPMARGYGLMGEAGPEAVMPLKRGRDGRLGVEASGGGVSFSPTINIIGTNKSPEQLAREIVKPLQAEMRRLELVSA